MADRFADLMAGSGLDVVSVAIVMALHEDERARKVCDPDEARLIDEGLCGRVRRGGVPTTALTPERRPLAVELRRSSRPGELALRIARVVRKQP